MDVASASMERAAWCSEVQARAAWGRCEATEAHKASSVERQTRVESFQEAELSELRSQEMDRSK